MNIPVFTPLLGAILVCFRLYYGTQTYCIMVQIERSSDPGLFDMLRGAPAGMFWSKKRSLHCKLLVRRFKNRIILTIA